MLLRTFGRWLFPINSYFFPVEGGYFCFDKEGDGDGGGGSGDGDGDGDGAGSGSGDGDGDGDGAGSGDGGDGGDGGSGDDSFDMSKLPESAQTYIKELRGENAKRRKENKGLGDKFNDLNGKFDTLQSGMKKALGLGDDDQMTPEQKVVALASERDQLTWDSHLKDLMLDHGVTKDSRDYFEFLVEKKAATLKEGEEIDDDAIAAIAQEAIAKSAKGNGNTSVGDGAGGDGKKPTPGGADNVTLDEFCNLGMGAKGQLFDTNPQLYNKLVSEAKAADRLV